MRGSGYPNAENTIRILRDRGGFRVEDHAHWLPEGIALWKSASGSRIAFLLKLCGIMLRSLGSAVRLMLQRIREDVVYAPYPAVFLLWWLSWIPRSFRPRVVADAYISLWDSAFRDRAMGARDGRLSRFANGFEGRALRAASMVLVDTIANREWMIRDFHIEPERIRAIPLAIDDRLLAQSSERREFAPAGAALRVIYLGTFVPLHGIGLVVDAVAQSAGNAGLEFQFVGDGQQSKLLEDLLAQPVQRISWRRQWLSEAGVADLLGQADVALGVFGGTGKASRVLPFKVYLSLAAGTPVVTQRDFSLPEGVPPPPLYLVDPDAGQIARKLSEIAAAHEQLAPASRAAVAYYREHLGPAAVLRAWEKLLGESRL